MSKLVTAALCVLAFTLGGILDSALEDSRKTDIALHAHDIETIVGVQHCDDVVVGFMVIDRSGTVTPHFEPGQTSEMVNAILNTAPQHAALRVCTEREQRVD